MPPKGREYAFGDSSNGGDVGPDASIEEMENFLAARRHLPPSVFNPARWAAAVGDAWWKKVVYLLNQGEGWGPYLFTPGTRIRCGRNTAYS